MASHQTASLRERFTFGRSGSRRGQRRAVAPDGGEKFADTYRFAQDFGRTEASEFFENGGGDVAAEHHDRHGYAVTCKGGKQIAAAEVGHVQVRDDEVVSGGFEANQCESGGAVGRSSHSMP